MQRVLIEENHESLVVKGRDRRQSLTFFRVE